MGYPPSRFRLQARCYPVVYRRKQQFRVSDSSSSRDIRRQQRSSPSVYCRAADRGAGTAELSVRSKMDWSAVQLESMKHIVCIIYRLCIALSGRDVRQDREEDVVLDTAFFSGSIWISDSGF